VYSAVQTRNYRLGTLFMADGRVHRVNGQINGNALTFYVDWSQPNLPASQLAGAQFTTRIFSSDQRAMAGTVSSGGGIYAVQAVKGTAPISGTAGPGPLSVASYLGTWDFNHDGWKGRLEISFSDPATRVFRGRYIDAVGNSFALQGGASPDGRQFAFDIGFATPQRFDGYLNGHELGVMGGTTAWGGMQFGFYGTRRP
jgi:hypothetical protein